MAIEDIVRWLRGEHDNMRNVADRLRERVLKCPPGDRRRWIEELRERYDAFADRFRERMNEEETGGYLKPLLQARPRLAEPVELLRREHRELAYLIESVHRAVHQLSPKALLTLRDCCKRIEDLLYWVERHEEHENHLVLYAFSEEPGSRN
jgi:hemerythrin-like domain-containing protein